MDAFTRWGVPTSEVIAFFTPSRGYWSFVKVDYILFSLLDLQHDDFVLWTRQDVTDLANLSIYARACVLIVYHLRADHLYS